MGLRTWAAEVGGQLVCNTCFPQESPNIGSFTWPPVDSELVAKSSSEAIEGAVRQALIAAKALCIHL